MLGRPSAELNHTNRTLYSNCNANNRPQRVYLVEFFWGVYLSKLRNLDLIKKNYKMLVNIVHFWEISRPFGVMYVQQFT